MLLSLAVLPAQTVISMLIFLPISLIYLVSGLPSYALMIFIFAGALPLISYGLQGVIEKRQWRSVALLTFFSLIPLVLAISSYEYGAVFSDHYGRPRLLMGYWHPKEAASAFAIPAFLYLRIKGPTASRLMMILFIAFLWVIGSRNLALSMMIIIGIVYFPSFLMISIVIGFFSFLFFLLMSGNYYDLIDEVLSSRLENWSNALLGAEQIMQVSAIGINRLSIDSYYIEVIYGCGLVGLLFFLGWAIVFYIKFVQKTDQGAWSKAFFCAILFSSAFDSGIMSTGNLFQIFSWVMVVIPIFCSGNKISSYIRAKNL